MTTKYTIERDRSHEVTIDFDYTPAFHGSWDEPPHDEEIEVNTVMLRRWDVYDLLTTEEVEAIAEHCFDAVSRDVMSRDDYDYDDE
jgi:hypothetical protein